jgi:hypothetical protein
MRDARAPAAGHSTHFNPQDWLLCHMGLYWFEFEFREKGKRNKNSGGFSIIGIERVPAPY